MRAYKGFQRILEIISAPHTEIPEVTAALEEAAMLDKRSRDCIADILEQQLAKETIESLSSGFLAELRTDAANIERLRKNSPVSVVGDLDEPDTYTLLSQAIAFVFENKGDKAAPFVKLYAEEAAKLTDADYALTENHIKILITVGEKLLAVNAAPPPPKPNPFRRNPAPGL